MDSDLVSFVCYCCGVGLQHYSIFMYTAI